MDSPDGTLQAHSVRRCYDDHEYLTLGRARTAFPMGMCMGIAVGCGICAGLFLDAAGMRVCCRASPGHPGDLTMKMRVDASASVSLCCSRKGGVAAQCDLHQV